MIEVEESAEAYIVRSAELQLAFRYLRDRWQHFVLVRLSEEWCRLLVSQEGSSDFANIPSPVLQDLRLERPTADVVEFQLLGQAHKDVYSAAVRFDATAAEIDFDLSARGRAPECRLCTRSTYLVTDYDATVAAGSPTGALAIRSGGGPGVTVAPVAIPFQPQSECRIVGEKFDGRIAAGVFDVAQSEANKQAITVRWRYRITPFAHP